jgi:CRISPR-associated protein Cas2
MFFLVCYDVETVTKEGRRRLRRVAKVCESHGQRAQKSVFECRMDLSLYLQFEERLRSIIDTESDSLRIYQIDEDSVRKIKQFGQTRLRDFEEPQII